MRLHHGESDKDFYTNGASKLVGGQVRKSALKSNGEVSKEALKKAEAMGPTAKFKGLTRQQKDDLARAVIAKALHPRVVRSRRLRRFSPSRRAMSRRFSRPPAMFRRFRSRG